MRRRLPDERESITHHVAIHSSELGEVNCYIIVGLYEDGSPGEIFFSMQKENKAIGLLMDQWAIALSIGLQSGVALRTFIDKFSWANFEPCGLTSNKEIPFCKSPVDYVARWMQRRFFNYLEHEKKEE